VSQRVFCTNALLHSARRNAPRDYPAKLYAIFTAPQWRQPAPVEAAMGVAVTAIARTLSTALEAIKELETVLDSTFAQHGLRVARCSGPGCGIGGYSRSAASAASEASAHCEASYRHGQQIDC
jgi:hypothetical protein